MTWQEHSQKPALEDVIGDLTTEGSVVECGLMRQTSSHIGRALARDAVEDAVYEVSQEEYELRQTPSNVGQNLAHNVMLDAVDELDQITDAKLCLTFRDRQEKMETEKPVEVEVVKEVQREMPKEAPSVLAKDLAKFAIGDAMAELQDTQDTSGVLAKDLAKFAIENAMTELQDMSDTQGVLAKDLAKHAIDDAMTELQDISDNYLRIDRVVCRETPSEIARDLAGKAVKDAALDIEETEGVDVEADGRQTPSNIARKLAKGAVARAKDDLQESSKLYKARKRSFYKSRSVEGGVTLQPTTKPRGTRSDVSRFLAKGALEDASTDLEQEGHDIDVVRRKTPSNLARDLAESTIKEVTADLEDDEVMHVIYRKTPSNLARTLAEGVMLDAADDFERDGECVVISLRKTPSNVARSLAKVAVVDAAQEISDQTEYTLPIPARKTPSDMGRGLVKGVLSDAVIELEREGKDVDGSLRSTPSNIARGLAKTAVSDAEVELDRQSPIYILPTARRRTPSDIARSVTDDVMTEAIGELEDGGQTVDGKSRKTSSNLARELAGSVISDAETEIAEGPPEDHAYQIRGKTSSNIAREVVADAFIDGIDEIEGEGKTVDGILRKTPSNLGRVLAQDVIGEALEELDKAVYSPTKISAVHDAEPHSKVSTTSVGVEDFNFNEDDLKEIWGDTSSNLNSKSILGSSTSLLASVIDVLSGPIAPQAADLDEEDEDEEEVIGFLENALIAENEPLRSNSDVHLTEVAHYTDDNKLVVEGAVKITSDRGPSTSGSVTEAALSMQSLTKNTSGQLIRESSSSSTGGEPKSPPLPQEDAKKGPQYFKLIPLYNNKSIDVGDEIIKTNLSALSIKPDFKKGLAVAHQAHERNSFRNIFRPDMTHCEGTARCLKDTLVTQLCQEVGADQKTVLDECCKALEEKQVDITAKHSDEELVTIGDVEGVCMWPKAQKRAYTAHVIDEPVPEKDKESDDTMIDQNIDSNRKSDDKGNASQKESEAQEFEKTHVENSTISTMKTTGEKPIKESDSGSQTTTTKKSSGFLDAVVNKISSVFRRRSNETAPLENEQPQVATDASGTIKIA